MTKQCGNCKWWDIENVSTNERSKIALCTYGDNRQDGTSSGLTQDTDGEDCQAYQDIGAAQSRLVIN